jgi:hypothetical protein
MERLNPPAILQATIDSFQGDERELVGVIRALIED